MDIYPSRAARKAPTVSTHKRELPPGDDLKESSEDVDKRNDDVTKTSIIKKTKPNNATGSFTKQEDERWKLASNLRSLCFYMSMASDKAMYVDFIFLGLLFWISKVTLRLIAKTLEAEVARELENTDSESGGESDLPEPDPEPPRKKRRLDVGM